MQMWMTDLFWQSGEILGPVVHRFTKQSRNKYQLYILKGLKVSFVLIKIEAMKNNRIYLEN